MTQPSREMKLLADSQVTVCLGEGYHLAENSSGVFVLFGEGDDPEQMRTIKFIRVGPYSDETLAHLVLKVITDDETSRKSEQ